MTVTKAQNFLSHEEQQKVTAAVQEAERITSGEIIPMIVSRSHEYPLAPITGGVVFGLPVALLVTHFLGPLFWLGQTNVYLFLASFFVLYTLAWFAIKQSDRLTRLFLHPGRAACEVERGAIMAFYEEGLYRTRQENGILLYISLLEKRVWILGDRGISKVIPQQQWDTTVDRLTSAIRAGKGCEGICEAIHDVGKTLKLHFPGQKHDVDELHNLIIR